jgi:hypothetical protein
MPSAQARRFTLVVFRFNATAALEAVTPCLIRSLSNAVSRSVHGFTMGFIAYQMYDTMFLPVRDETALVASFPGFAPLAGHRRNSAKGGYCGRYHGGPAAAQRHVFRRPHLQQAVHRARPLQAGTRRQIRKSASLGWS